MTMVNSKQAKKTAAPSWFLDRVKGSHHQFNHPAKPGLVTVKHLAGDIPQGTLALSPLVYKRAQDEIHGGFLHGRQPA